jgi:hypothetical protein
VIAGDEHDRGSRQCFPQALELAESEYNGGVGWTNRMKQISRDHHSVGSSRNYPIDSSAKGLGYISLPLIDAASGLPVILPDTKVRIREVSEFHRWRMDDEPGKSKQFGEL